MIPYLDLKAQHASIDAAIREAVDRVVASGHYILGPEVEAFEREFARWTGSDHAVGVASGTDALYLALRAAGIGPGDEVITTPFTFVATTAAILYAGARPVFADIDPVTFACDPRRVREAVTSRTRALLPVHLYGQPADMESLVAVARDHDLVLIEDAAQAHGARFGDRRVGTFGAMGCFSFYPTKNLGACGEGGLIVTGDPGLARSLRMLRDWGQESKGRHEVKGFNSRLHAMQAAILRVKLPHLDAWNDARRRHAAGYAARLAGRGVVTPAEAPGTQHVYHAYTVRVPHRDAVRETLAEQGIQTGLHYPQAVHRQPAYADLGYPAGAFPEAERAAAEVLSLPIYPEMTDAQRDAVCDALARALEAPSR